MAKLTHSFCQYRQGNPQTNCANCHHYTGNSCEIVEDPIKPEMLCNFHVPAQQQAPQATQGMLGQMGHGLLGGRAY